MSLAKYWSSQEAFVRSKILFTVIAALGLGVGTSAGALSSHEKGEHGKGHNVQLHGPSRWSVSLLSFYDDNGDHPKGGGALGPPRGSPRGPVYGTGGPPHTKPPRDAGYVPEPGAVGVFSIGLLMAGALIRRLGRKA
jgi:hypothetical protein